MAMSMQGPVVVGEILAALAGRRGVVDINQALRGKGQATGGTRALLFRQETPQGRGGEGVVFQALSPVRQVAVVGRCPSPYLHVTLDVRVGVVPQPEALVVPVEHGELPAPAGGE